MLLSDIYSNINFLFRWVHVITGIIWLGHLYVFNFVTIPLRRALDDTERRTTYPKLMLRSLWWSRWGAMIAFLTGPVLFVMNYLYAPGAGFGPTALLIDQQGITARAAWILFGMILAGVMWFNVWFIVWPAFKSEMTGKISSEKHLQVLRLPFRTDVVRDAGPGALRSDQSGNLADCPGDWDFSHLGRH